MGIGSFREEHPEGQIVHFLQFNFYEITALFPELNQTFVIDLSLDLNSSSYKLTVVNQISFQIWNYWRF